MPLIARIFLKTGVVYFVLSLMLGLIIQLEILTIPPLFYLFWHMLMLGWITQIIMGVSMWMFPGRVREESFKNQQWGWVAYVGLNIGLVLRIIAEPWVNTSSAQIWRILLLISALLQFVAVVSYAREIWPRVKGKKKRIVRKKRTAKGS